MWGFSGKSKPRGLAGPGIVHSILVFKAAALSCVSTLCLCICNELYLAFLCVEKNLNSLLSCWNHWKVTPSGWQTGHPLTTHQHYILCLIWTGTHKTVHKSSWLHLISLLLPPPTSSRKIPSHSRSMKFNWMTDKTRLNQHIGRSLTESTPPSEWFTSQKLLQQCVLKVWKKEHCQSRTLLVAKEWLQVLV